MQGALAGVWHREKLQTYTCSRDSKVYRTRKSSCTSSLPCFYRMWHNLVILGRGRKTAWQAWEQFPEVTSVFKRLSNPDVGVAVVENEMAILEEFTVSLYSKKLETKCVNEARELLFSQGKRSIENLPPTKNALVQHALRSAYQAGIIWGQSLNPLPDLPSPSLFGWEKETEESGWNPTWTDLPEASKVCRELIKCSCKKKCGGRCKCTKLQLKCSKLCSCSCK